MAAFNAYLNTMEKGSHGPSTGSGRTEFGPLPFVVSLSNHSDLKLKI